MKQELLEYIVRACANEVLNQVKAINEGEKSTDDMDESDVDPDSDETKGAAAPPADGQGTADQPAVPKSEPVASAPETKPEQPQTPSTPAAPPAPDLKGIVFINPRDKSKLQKIDVRAADDATLERNLHSLASRSAGPKVKIALSTMRAVKAAAQNPNSSVYLYIGQYDPNSEELFVMADNSLQVAKDASVDPSLISSGVSGLSGDQFNPLAASADDFADRMQNQGYRQPVEFAELKKSIKKIVSEMLDAE